MLGSLFSLSASSSTFSAFGLAFHTYYSFLGLCWYFLSLYWWPSLGYFSVSCTSSLGFTSSPSPFFLNKRVLVPFLTEYISPAWRCFLSFYISRCSLCSLYVFYFSSLFLFLSSICFLLSSTLLTLSSSYNFLLSSYLFYLYASSNFIFLSLPFYSLVLVSCHP